MKYTEYFNGNVFYRKLGKIVVCKINPSYYYKEKDIKMKIQNYLLCDFIVVYMIITLNNNIKQSDMMVHVCNREYGGKVMGSRVHGHFTREQRKSGLRKKLSEETISSMN